MRSTPLILFLALLSGAVLRPSGSCGQQAGDTSNTVTVNILQTDQGFLSEAGRRLIGNVILQQGGTQMFCDSAYMTADNNVEAFGNVRIVQPGGTEVESDYLRYTGNTRFAYLRGAVALTDGASTLWSEVLTYDLGRKVGNYTEGGTLQSGETVLSSRRGTYNVKSKDARFTGAVIVNNPRYDVISDDLGYNTEKKIVRFFGPSVVTNAESELRTTSGTYDEVREIARFRTRSSIWSNAQYVEADTMDYNRGTGFGLARGDVYALDTAQQVTMWSSYAAYNEKLNTLLSTRKPVLRRVSGEDTIYMAADTFFSAPDILREEGKGKGERAAEDTVVVKRKPKAQPAKAAPKKGRAQAVASPAATATDALARRAPEVQMPVVPGYIAPEDSTAADTAKARYFIGYRGVRVFSDSMQAICDSIRYTQRDSSLRLIRDPVAWARRAQISGDTIVLVSDSSKIRRLWVPNNALVVSRSGPEKAKLFDQVQGRTLRGFFDDSGALREIVVFPAAESVNYQTDNDGAYVGVAESQGERMRVFFRNQKIERVAIEQDPKNTMIPLKEPGATTLRLNRFVWREEDRPKSVEELFE